MIPLTRLNGDHIAINPDRIERADVTPDVVLTMTDGSKYVIAESLDELIDRIRYFRASILALSQNLSVEAGNDEPGRLRLLSGAAGGTGGDHVIIQHVPSAGDDGISADGSSSDLHGPDPDAGGDTSTAVVGDPRSAPDGAPLTGHELRRSRRSGA